MSATGSRKAVCDVPQKTSRTDKGDWPVSPVLTGEISGLHSLLSHKPGTTIKDMPPIGTPRNYCDPVNDAIFYGTVAAYTMILVFPEQYI